MAVRTTQATNMPIHLIYRYVHRHHQIASSRDQCEQKSVVGKRPIILYIVHKRSVLRVMPGKLIMQLSNNADIHPTNRHKKTEEEGQEKIRAS